MTTGTATPDFPRVTVPWYLGRRPRTFPAVVWVAGDSKVSHARDIGSRITSAAASTVVDFGATLWIIPLPRNSHGFKDGERPPQAPRFSGHVTETRLRDIAIHGLHPTHALGGSSRSRQSTGVEGTPK